LEAHSGDPAPISGPVGVIPLLLDTNVVSTLFKPDHSLHKRSFEIVAGHQWFISFMTRGERCEAGQAKVATSSDKSGGFHCT
jgi:hypothetical protein